MIGSTGQCAPALRATAGIVDSIAALPAVAMLDWTDRAAASLATMANPSRSCVIICTIDEHGAVSHHEATGVASRRGDGAGGEEQSVELTLRSRGERLDHVGFRVTQGHLSGGIYDSLDRLLQTPDWRSRGLGRLWAGVPAGEVLVGIQGLGEAVPGRAMISMVGVGTAESQEARDMRVAVLQAVLPILTRRAKLAIGTERTSASRWLTAREQQVLDELILGKSVRQIAEEIGRSPHTVHDHVKSLHRKLNASSRGELVARALGYLGAREARASEADSASEERIAEIKTASRDASTLRRPATPLVQSRPVSPAPGQASPAPAPSGAVDGEPRPTIDTASRIGSSETHSDRL
ncbi:MAG: helix-turn-helix transcriptional regulator [Planctomycetota bacterium]